MACNRAWKKSAAVLVAVLVLVWAGTAWAVDSGTGTELTMHFGGWNGNAPWHPDTASADYYCRAYPGEVSGVITAQLWVSQQGLGVTWQVCTVTVTEGADGFAEVAFGAPVNKTYYCKKLDEQGYMYLATTKTLHTYVTDEYFNTGYIYLTGNRSGGLLGSPGTAPATSPATAPSRDWHTLKDKLFAWVPGFPMWQTDAPESWLYTVQIPWVDGSNKEFQIECVGGLVQYVRIPVYHIIKWASILGVAWRVMKDVRAY